MSDNGTCLWSHEDDDFSVWDTGCNNAFFFDTGGPEDNGFKFCPYCGKGLVVCQPDEIEAAERQGE